MFQCFSLHDLLNFRLCLDYYCFVSGKLTSPETYVYRSLDGTSKIVIVFKTEKDVDYRNIFGTSDIELYDTKVCFYLEKNLG